MRLKIGKKVYPMPELDGVRLIDILRFEGEVRDFRADSTWTWPDVLGASQEFEGLSEIELGTHPKWPWFLASMIWAARREKGEDVTFEGALEEISQSDVDFIEDPEDHKPGKPKGAKKPRKASAPATAPAGDEAEPTTSVPQESESPSKAG